MIAAPRLYERVNALWYLDEGRTLFAGPLDYNASHQHGAPVYLAGLYGPFGIRMAGSRWKSCLTAVIPAGVQHILDIGGNPLAVFYPSPPSRVPFPDAARTRYARSRRRAHRPARRGLAVSRPL